MQSTSAAAVFLGILLLFAPPATAEGPPEPSAKTSGPAEGSPEDPPEDPPETSGPAEGPLETAEGPPETAGTAEGPLDPASRIRDLRAPFDGWTSLVNRNSGLVLGIAGSSDANGARVIQWPLVRMSNGQAIPDQDWLWVRRGSDVHVSFRNAGTWAGTPNAPGSWKALSIARGSTANGAKAIQWPYSAEIQDQQWLVDDRGNGYFRLVNVRSGKCLGIPRASTARGVQAIQWSCNNSHDQQWWWLDT